MNTACGPSSNISLDALKRKEDLKMLSVVLVPHILAHRTSIIIWQCSGKVTEFSDIMNSVGSLCSRGYSFSSMSLYFVGSKTNSFARHQRLISPS